MKKAYRINKTAMTLARMQKDLPVDRESDDRQPRCGCETRIYVKDTN